MIAAHGCQVVTLCTSRFMDNLLIGKMLEVRDSRASGMTGHLPCLLPQVSNEAHNPSDSRPRTDMAEFTISGPRMDISNTLTLIVWLATSQAGGWSNDRSAYSSA